METLADILSLVVPGVCALFFLAASVTSAAEGERRATVLLSAAFLLSLLLLFILNAWLSPLPQLIVTGTLLAASLVFLLPFSGRLKFRSLEPGSRFHEADAVLSRRLLQPGSREYEAYYALHPGFKAADDAARAAPGLLSPDARYYDPVTFSAAAASFRLVDRLHDLCEGEAATGGPKATAGERNSAAGGPSARMFRQWLIQSGAHSAGVTQLKEKHLYSHKGRGSRAGEPIEKKHEFAIAFTVEMNHRMMQSAPQGSTVMESAGKYLLSGTLAVQLALLIRRMGYEATAHIDGNYEVICPLVAADAGLGEIGRMGLLMTPRLGPRVRIAVVTTNLPLEPDPGRRDLSMQDFCDRCKKCASVCPAAAIPSSGRRSVDGVERWQISSERCYHFWSVSGTDCGRCVAGCPYAHPDNWFHRFIRFGIKNNLVFRVMAVKLDDLFYGKRPAVRPLPGWISNNSQE